MEKEGWMVQHSWGEDDEKEKGNEDDGKEEEKEDSERDVAGGFCW